MPGYFAGPRSRSKQPATLLITTQVVVPFVHEDDDVGRWWKPEAGIGFALERWQTHIDGLAYAIRHGDDGVHALGGRHADIFADAARWEVHGHQNTVWSLMHRVDDLSALMALMTTGPILRDIQSRLAALRDSLAAVAAVSSKEQLASVRSQLGTLSSDLTSFTAEVAAWSDHPDWALHEIPSLTVIGRPDAQPVPQRLVEWFVEEARRVRAFEASTRELLVATAEITSALETMNVQTMVQWVSVLALIVALAALVVSGVGVANDLGLMR